MDYGYALEGTLVLHICMFAAIRAAEMEFTSSRAFLVCDILSLVP